jgi:hypothetical protein
LYSPYYICILQQEFREKTVIIWKRVPKREEVAGSWRKLHNEVK